MGRSAEEVARKSGLEPSFLQRGLITTPHSIAYEDDRVAMFLGECANSISMPTSLGFTAGSLAVWSASVLGEYADLGRSISEADRQLSYFLDRGFKFRSNDPYARFASLGSCSAEVTGAPQSVPDIRDIRSLMLNRDYCTTGVNVFVLDKDGLQVSLRLENMRRTFPDTISDLEMVRREKSMSERELEEEKAYYLDFGMLAVTPSGDVDLYPREHAPIRNQK
jgi:hypothetical protein